MRSWKEIANHLGMSVRTVQRWEERYGLPVRRFNRSRRTPVMAFADEIDLWQRAATFCGNGTVDQLNEDAARTSDVNGS